MTKCCPYSSSKLWKLSTPSLIYARICTMVRQTRATTERGNAVGKMVNDSKIRKTRRSHKKSRNGCAECKRRHIRCDERQPSCGNCHAADRQCCYPVANASVRGQGLQGEHVTSHQHGQKVANTSLDLSPRLIDQTTANDDDGHLHPTAIERTPTQPLPHRRQAENLPPSTAPEEPSLLSLLSSEPLLLLDNQEFNPYQIPSPASPTQLGDSYYNSAAGCHPGLSRVPDTVSKAIFTPQHMILLHHAHLVPNFTGPNRSAVDVAVRRAIDSPYLLDEVLSFTAFHLAYLYPGSAENLRRLATELQTRALASFTRLTETTPPDDKATAVPRFMFSGILGRHVLADTVSYHCSDFHTFIDRFIACLSLNRGIRAVIPPAREYLNNTEIQPFLNVILEAQKKITSPGNECAPLTRLINESDLGEASLSACHQAVEVLQWSFDLFQGLDEEEYPQSASAFSVRIGTGFADMLRKQRPEALVILAYYGVILYRCRSFWAFRGAGASIINLISKHLGSYWQDALAWPLHVIQTEYNTESVIPTPST